MISVKERVGEAAERPVAAAGDRAGDPADGRIRPLVTTYLGRRMPWGTPWWTYALALGAANLARQVVIPDGLSSAVEVGIFVLMVGVVGGVVTVVDLTVRRRPAPARTIERRVNR